MNRVGDPAQDPDGDDACFGMWGGLLGGLAGDLTSRRHNGSATVGFYEGFVLSFVFPAESNELIREDADLEADDFLVASSKAPT